MAAITMAAFLLLAGCGEDGNSSSGTRPSPDSVVGPTLAVTNEVHLNVNWGDLITPQVGGRLVSLSSMQAVNTNTHLTGATYVEGIDYRVNFALNRVEIITTGNIPPHSDIAISYTTQF